MHYLPTVGKPIKLRTLLVTVTKISLPECYVTFLNTYRIMLEEKKNSMRVKEEMVERKRKAFEVNIVGTI